MRRPDRIAGIGLFVVAAYTVYEATVVLPLFSFGQPGSGLLPFLLGLALAGLAVPLVLSREGTAAPGAAEPFVSAAGVKRLVLALGLLALGAVTFEPLGAPASAGLLVALWLALLERKPALTAVTVGLLTGLGIWLVFGVGLKAELPRGIWSR